MFKPRHGFTLIELLSVIVVIGILSTVAIPKFLELRVEAEKAAVETMLGSLESAMSIYASRQYMNGSSITVHNPFDDFSNIPENYYGVNDPVTPANTPDRTWSYRTSGNWIMYNPKVSISGGWLNQGERFIIYKVEVVTEGTDTVGIRLNTTAAYTYTWN